MADGDEAALPLHHIVVSLLCILLIIKEEEVSCLVGVVEVDVQNHDHEDGEGSGHVLLGENTISFVFHSHVHVLISW